MMMLSQAEYAGAKAAATWALVPWSRSHLIPFPEEVRPLLTYHAERWPAFGPHVSKAGGVP